MKILGLYNNPCAEELFEWLKKQGHEVIIRSDRLEYEWCAKERFDLTVSYTYRFILPEDIIDSLNSNVVNLHNSFLPWNRGADPNLWSIVDNTPRGVTLHYITKDLDKGDIIAQELIDYSDDQSLHESYYQLDDAARTMFKKCFAYYLKWDEMRKRAVGIGNYHSVKDGRKMKNSIDSYDMTIREFRSRLMGKDKMQDG